MIEVYGRHTGEHIKELMLECIFSYGISANQIYSLTTDNGSNMIKSVQLFLDGDEEEEDIDFDELNRNNDEEEEELVINELSESIRDVVRGFLCAAHTLQLAVLDVLKLKSVDRLIGKARAAMKALKNQVFMVSIRRSKLKKPILDGKTRWNSTLAMLARLLELREFITEIENSHADLKISEIQWVGIQEICSVLEPARKASVRLQMQQLTIGDFYKLWTSCKMDVEEIDTVFAKAFSVALQTRENLLMDNDIFRSAIYLDPRIKVILSTDERVKAKAYLVNLWQAVHQMRLDRNSNNNSFPHGHAESFIGPLDKFESAMRERENFMVSPAFTIENKRIDHLLENFEGHPRINSTENLLEW
ncbi:uncharacterized protein LOC123472613 [Daphnia magna]|uniref:uncharacterized protein LOC123472613 n=1 Tax=Daphnia magna TaxID=35525 RepID=UPI001E1BBB5B|nr:uncharacterized protein LOC123472613 [Daphnia magna]